MEVYKFKCKNCGSTKYEKINEKTYKCPYCGYSEEVFIQENDNNKDAEIQELREVIEELTETQKQKQQFHEDSVERNALVSFLLCFFGGWLGLHRFFEGRFILGIIYFCTFGLFGFGVGIDFLIRLVNLISAFRKNKHK